MISAFLLGLLGSWHCAAMCGNLVGALCRQQGLAAYTLGRLLSYTLSGALLGVMGSWLLPWMGWRLALAIAGTALIVLALAQTRLAQGLDSISSTHKPTLTAQIWLQLGPYLKSPRPTPSTRFALGLVTVLFPCGLLTAAWVRASATGSPWLGAATMFCFGLGSLPGLFAPRFLMGLLPPLWQPRVQKTALLLSGIWMLFLALRWQIPDSAAPGLHCL